MLGSLNAKCKAIPATKYVFYLLKTDYFFFPWTPLIELISMASVLLSLERHIIASLLTL